MFCRSILLALLFLSGNLAYADEKPTHEATRGELLYETHCVACHNAQVHWRDKELAKDWGGIKAEVSRWQTFSRLRWSDADVEAVAGYLNTLYYHYRTPPQP